MLPQVAAEALDASVDVGAGVYARRNCPQGEAELNDPVDASVTTYYDGLSFLLEAFESFRNVLSIPNSEDISTHPEVPVENPTACIKFPSFDDILTSVQLGEAESSMPIATEGRFSSLGALATAAARLFAFFSVNCFNKQLPKSIRLHISRGTNLYKPTMASVQFVRDLSKGELRAEWKIDIHPEIKHLPILGKYLNLLRLRIGSSLIVSVVPYG